MNREQALELLYANMQNQNLRRHCYAVEAVMRALAKHFGEDPDIWGIAGLLHDSDYELTKDMPPKHTHIVEGWLKERNADKRIIDAILAHGYGYVEGNPEPVTKMEWSLYTCDELTGLIVATALVKGRSLDNVTAESVLKKFPEKSFAAGVDREQIKLCEQQLGIPINEFAAIALEAMKGIHTELGL